MQVVPSPTVHLQAPAYRWLQVWCARVGAGARAGPPQGIHACEWPGAFQLSEVCMCVCDGRYCESKFIPSPCCADT
eukprot:1143818-Pelagomonas_calceolata.AAC.8